MALKEKQLSSAEIADRSLAEDEDTELLNKPLDDIRLSVRAQKCLQKLNIHTLSDLIQRTDAELLGVKNFGVTSLNEIKKALGKLGLSLRALD
ncbi:DNA-directed RNA polymerase subunit alpha [subsurface metagenome]